MHANDRSGSPDRDFNKEDTGDLDLSEDATYRETIRGVRSFMGWHDISKFDRVSSSDDNPFAGSRVQPTGKVSVKLPVDEWLCRKMEKLNLTHYSGLHFQKCRNFWFTPGPVYQTTKVI